MRTYHLKPEDTIVFSADGGAWETISFKAADFADIAEATAGEVAQKLNHSASLAARAGAEGSLIIETKSRGGHASLEFDLAHSTAAAAFGITAERAKARGNGLSAARVVSLNAEPFALSHGAEMSLKVDGSKRKIAFDKGFSPKKATAAEVARIINSKHKGVASASKDGQVILTSPTVGPDSSIEVIASPEEPGKADAAAVLGFIGHSGFDHPHRAEPACLVCTEVARGIQVENLTADLIELHLVSGIASLPPRGSLPLKEVDAGSRQLQNYITQGKVRLTQSS